MAQPVMAMGVAQPGVVVQQAATQNVVYVQANGQPHEHPQENCAKVMFILTCCSILFWPFIFVGFVNLCMHGCHPNPKVKRWGCYTLIPLLLYIILYAVLISVIINLLAGFGAATSSGMSSLGYCS